MRAWKKALREDESANIVAVPLAGSKRKAVSIHAPRTPPPCRACLGRRAGRSFPDAAKCALPTGHQCGRGGNSQQIRHRRARQGTCPRLPDSAVLLASPRCPSVARALRLVPIPMPIPPRPGAWGPGMPGGPSRASQRAHPADLAFFFVHSSVSTSLRFVVPLAPSSHVTPPLPGRPSAWNIIAL